MFEVIEFYIYLVFFYKLKDKLVLLLESLKELYKGIFFLFVVDYDVDELIFVVVMLEEEVKKEEFCVFLFKLLIGYLE